MAVQVAGRLFPFDFWEPSGRNPADAPSSWFGVRADRARRDGGCGPRPDMPRPAEQRSAAPAAPLSQLDIGGTPTFSGGWSANVPDAALRLAFLAGICASRPTTIFWTQLSLEPSGACAGAAGSLDRTGAHAAKPGPGSCTAEEGLSRCGLGSSPSGSLVFVGPAGLDATNTRSCCCATWIALEASC
eukprot:11169324-Lingulodinium_polyedra.AAC.1